MSKHIRWFPPLLAAVAALVLTAAWTPRTKPGDPIPLDIARIFFEYNQSDNDLGVHVFLDGEDWKNLEIRAPSGKVIFDVMGKGGFKELGMTELFFEGAEPSLLKFPLGDLLDLFPQGEYAFSGKTAEGDKIESEATFTHAVPDGPAVFSQVGPNNFVQISWNPVLGPAPGFPNLPIVIAGYQVVVGSFQVTLPASATSVTVPPEYVASLGPGQHEFEVLAIEAGGNQTITIGFFTLP